jgi:2,4-dienoyl-CoA reductase-like NADH-dependent reductase (Old Yellow Enzyme family)
MKLPTTIVERMRKAVGPDFIIVFRLSMLDLIKEGSTWTEIVELAKALEDAVRISKTRLYTTPKDIPFNAQALYIDEGSIHTKHVLLNTYCCVVMWTTVLV